MKMITSANIEFNYSDFKDMYDKTGFNLAEVLWDVLRDNPNREFEREGITFKINPPMFMNIKDVNWEIYLFVYANADIDNSTPNARYIYQDIYLHIETIANEIKEKLNTIQIPLNTDNVKYIEEDEAFYVKAGCPSPEMMTLDCDLINTIEDIFPYTDLPIEEDKEDTLPKWMEIPKTDKDEMDFNDYMSEIER